MEFPTCRVCTKSENLESLFIERNGHVISEFIEELTKVEINLKDLSTMICGTCLEKLDVVIDFLTTFHASNKYFVSLIENDLKSEEIFEEEEYLDEIKNEEYGGVPNDEHLIQLEIISMVQEPVLAKVYASKRDIPKTKSKFEKSLNNPKLNQCKTCGKIFKNSSCLKIHAITHVNRNDLKQSFNCDVCFKTFSTRGNLKAHLEEIHVGHKKFQCSFCEKEFYKLNNYNVHLNRHTLKYMQSCTLCEKSFNNKTLLTNHMRVHTKERPYKCSFCEKTYSHQTDMRRHRWSHSEPRLRCEICDKGYNKKTALLIHLRIHERERKSYVCKCSKSYVQVASFKKHTATCLMEFGT